MEEPVPRFRFARECHMNRETPPRFVGRASRRAFLVATAAAATSTIGLRPAVRAHDETPTPVASAAGTPEASPVDSPVASPVPNTPVFESPMQGLKYLPAQIEIEVGTTVLWINEDVVAHTVTHRAKPEDQLFDSPYIEPGETFTYTFEKAGTFQVFCLPHPFMTQTVIVSEKS
jgi:plastocyanin